MLKTSHGCSGKFICSVVPGHFQELEVGNGPVGRLVVILKRIPRQPNRLKRSLQGQLAATLHEHTVKSNSDHGVWMIPAAWLDADDMTQDSGVPR